MEKSLVRQTPCIYSWEFMEKLVGALNASYDAGVSAGMEWRRYHASQIMFAVSQDAYRMELNNILSVTPLKLGDHLPRYSQAKLYGILFITPPSEYIGGEIDGEQ